MVASIKEKAGREEGIEDEEGGERRIRGQIVQEVVAGMQEKISEHSGDKEAVQKPAGQTFMRRWIAHRSCMKKRRKAGEKEIKWQHSGEEEQKLEEIVERRRSEGKILEAGGHAKGAGACGA